MKKLVLISILILILIAPVQSAIINPSVDNQNPICKNTFLRWICDIQKPGATGGIGREGPANMTPNMTAGPQGPAGVGGGQVLYFHHDAVPDPVGFEGLNIIPAGSAEDDETVSVTAADGLKVFDPYITITGYPGTTTWPAGLWRFRTFHYVDSFVGDSRIVFTVYNRTAAGTMTKLFEAMSDEIDDATATEHLTPYVQNLDYTVANTDRMVINVSANTTSIVAKTVHFVYEGSLHTSHVQTPFPLAYTVPPMINESYAYLPGRSGGQILNGGTSKSDTLTLKSSTGNLGGFINLQPLNGSVSIGTPILSGYQSGLDIGMNNKSYGIVISGNSEGQSDTSIYGQSISLTAKKANVRGINVALSGGGSNAQYAGVFRTQDGLSNIGVRIERTDSNTSYGLHILGGSIGAGSPNNNYSIYSAAAARSYFAGNISIGTATPTSQFDTTGTVRFRKFGAGTLTTDASGNLYTVSDEKLKTNIIPYTGGLSDILKVNPISYKFNAASGLDTANVYTGFSAQNLKTAIPSSVFEKGDTTYIQEMKKDGSGDSIPVEVPILDSNGKQTTTLSISDRAIIAAQINAIKELNAKIDSQQKEIDELKLKVGLK